jgi:hypothetical protein
MKKSLEVVILAAFCLASIILGWIAGGGMRDIGIALFFYLLSACFFLRYFGHIRHCDLSMIICMWFISPRVIRG